MAKWIRNNRGFLAFLVLFGLFRTAVADWNPIPSGSMRPTLLEGDVVFVNRLAFDLKVPLTNMIVAHLGEPRRGDVVTFFSPRDGLLMNLLNPKVTVFFVAFLPQFVDPAAGPALAQIVLLGLLFDVQGTVVNVAVALPPGVAGRSTMVVSGDVASSDRPITTGS